MQINNFKSPETRRDERPSEENNLEELKNKFVDAIDWRDKRYREIICQARDSDAKKIKEIQFENLATHNNIVFDYAKMKKVKFT